MGRRAFPPGIGWIPIVIALLIAATVSVVAAVPQFKDRVVGVEPLSSQAAVASGTGAGPAAGVPGGAGPSASAQSGLGGPGTGHQTTAGGQRAGAPAGQAAADCSRGQNAGATAPGVSATEIHIATTEVTTGVGKDFLREAVSGMQAAIAQVNSSGGVCGRRIVLDHVNDGWDGPTGQQYISGFINSGSYFALVGEPDSEGLRAAIESGTIDGAKMPVVGTDGMLADQYFDPWVWPVAASTVTNMHVAAKYAYDHGARSFAIVFDRKYKFGKEGAYAFDQEVRRLTGQDIDGFSSNQDGNACVKRYCAIDPSTNDYSSSINQLDNACSPPCDVVMMLLEPGPMESWMNGEKSAGGDWYKTLMGGEPLFDDNLGTNCDSCGGMIVWTGYKPDIQPFDGSKAVYGFAQALHSVCPSCDTQNEFTEGAYLGTQLFIEACRRVGPDLTRDALKQVLDTMTLDFGLSQPLSWGTAAPRVANYSLAAFSDNFSGSFNGWNYLGTGYLADGARTQDFRSS